jgi:ribonuclease BN (tRNA processing enzyme)
MKITIVGTASGLATAGRNHAALLVEIGEDVLLLDAGEGTAKAMLDESLDPNAIHNIIVTHTHPDHCAGLSGLIQYMHLTARGDPLGIYLPAEFVDTFQQYLNAVYLINEKLSFTYCLKGWESGPVLNGAEYQVSAHLTKHLESVKAVADSMGIGVRSAALRIQGEGKMVVYSSDLGGIEDLGDLPRQADLLLLECTHVDLEAIMEAVVGWEVHKVLLTHIPAELDGKTLALRDMAAKWDFRDIQFARDGMRVVL